MGVLLMAEGIHPRVELNPVKLIPGNANRSSESNSNEEVVNGPSPPVSTRVTEMIDVVESNDEPARWMPPPPKKKWIRHYLLEEEPHENSRINGNHSSGLRGSPVISNSRGTPPSANSGHLTALHSTHHQQHHHHNNHDNMPNHLDNHNSNHTQSNIVYVDVESGHDNKKPRNGPCVIRSGTREVHNKLEKNRRAHLKECFEMLKKQLPTQDEKKSSNLSILHAAIRHIQGLRRKERDYDHEMERLAREKIAAQQRLDALRKELASTWDHIDFSTLLPEENCAMDTTISKNVPEGMDVDVTGLARGGTRYSSTSSLSSAATASSPQTLQTTSSTSNIHNQVATAAVVCQTQGLNLAQGSRESPPASSSPGASTPSIPTPAQEKLSTSPTLVQQQQQQQHPQQQQHQQQQPQHQYQQQQQSMQQYQQQQGPQQQGPQQQQQHQQLHLPISAQMLSTSQGLATIVPTLQHLGSGLRVIPGDRQLLVTHTTGNNESRPLIAMQSNTGSEPRPVALVVHSSTASDNRVTFVHSNLSNNDRPLALAVQSSSSDVRPVTFVHSGNESRPLVLATHSPALSVSTAQTRIRTGDAQTTHKMVGGVTLVGGSGSELTRLPGGAELNILPANGLTLSHAGVSLQSAPAKGNSTVVQNAPSTEGIAHIVGQHTPLSVSGLTPIVTPMTVVSQGNQQVTAHILAPSSLAGKMITTTPILKPFVKAQYLNTATLVNSPLVVVSSPSNSSPPSTATSCTQPSSTTHSSV
ncbi:flocculation protein FLO11-like isoform X3 [Belonocnema kinseyi]|uniref:flocculation protein FLO11-like isoform X3 n=1 Tax=Belonocnema kinseyi TaxID=2817044 RepID=UPI00143DEAB9|nr:flocculation protein FLO11-like isoform X3 [Belonocnema kinseyi]